MKINDHSFFTLIFPVLIVPDNKLWQAKYDEQGVRQGKPERIRKVSYFIGKEWSTGGADSITYSISHLEILTFTEIENFVEDYLFEYLDNCNFTISSKTEFMNIPK